MEQLTTYCHILTEKAYILDENAYKVLGSLLSRMLIGGREEVFSLLKYELSLCPQGQLILSDTALIGDMARILPNGVSRKQLPTEYSNIIVELKAFEEESAKSDISGQECVFLSLFATGTKLFSKDDHPVIHIGCSYSSGDTKIGFQLADNLHINYYDATIFRNVLKYLQARREVIEKRDTAETLHEMRHTHGLELFTADFNRLHSLPTADVFFFNQSQYIEELVQKEDFVVMGHSADVVLKSTGIPRISVFITVPLGSHMKCSMETHRLSFKEVAKLLKHGDKVHEYFHHRYAGSEWSSAARYGSCINLTSYDIHESEEFIIHMTKVRLREDLQVLIVRHQEFVGKTNAKLLAGWAERVVDGTRNNTLFSSIGFHTGVPGAKPPPGLFRIFV